MILKLIKHAKTNLDATPVALLTKVKILLNCDLLDTWARITLLQHFILVRNWCTLIRCACPKQGPCP